MMQLEFTIAITNDESQSAREKCYHTNTINIIENKDVFNAFALVSVFFY